MIYKVCIVDGYIADKKRTTIDCSAIREMRVLRRLSERTYVALINEDYIIALARLIIAPQVVLREQKERTISLN